MGIAIARAHTRVELVFEITKNKTISTFQNQQGEGGGAGSNNGKREGGKKKKRVPWPRTEINLNVPGTVL
jgi:hypothetical protein